MVKYPSVANVDVFAAGGVELRDISPSYFITPEHYSAAVQKLKDDLKEDGFTADGLGWDDAWHLRGHGSDDLPLHEGLQECLIDLFGEKMAPDVDCFGDHVDRAKALLFDKPEKALDANVKACYYLWLKGFSNDKVCTAHSSHYIRSLARGCSGRDLFSWLGGMHRLLHTVARCH